MEVTRLKKELKNVKKQIEKCLKLRDGSEVLDEMLSAQKHNKDKSELGFEKGEISTTSSIEDKEKEKVKDELKDSRKNKKRFHSILKQ